MGRTGRVVHEERAVRCKRRLLQDPSASVIGEIFIEGVVVLAPWRRSHLKGPRTFGELGMPLVGLGSDEAIKVIEALVSGPVVIGTGEGRLGIGDKVPFADACGGIAVLAKNLGDECGTLGDGARVAGVVVGPVDDGTHAHGVIVASRKKCGAGGRAESRHMKACIAQAVACKSVKRGSGDKATEGLRSENNPHHPTE